MSTQQKGAVKVLIIEDEQLLQDAYRQVLEYKGYEVAVADDGLQAIERLEEFKPQVVLLDVLMPRLDGIGFLKKSKIRQKYPGVKIIACTNLSDRDTADQMLSNGADRQVLKSDLSPAELVALVRELAEDIHK